jgi:hypothetical protein
VTVIITNGQRRRLASARRSHLKKVLLIQSKSPWESGDLAPFCSLERELATAGNEVTLFLVQNG